VSELIGNFHFLRPHWLMLLLPCLLLGLLLWRHRGREGNWSRVVAPELLPHLISSDAVARSRSGIPALIVAWCLASFAAAGPSWQQLPQPVLQKQDALVLIMDLSYSMLATDLQPSRQDRVRRKLLDLLRERREGLTALIAYAGDAHIVAPLTDDNPTIANLLPALTPDMMPLPGSNPVDAVERATALLDSAGVRNGRLLLVTDGISAADATAISALLSRESRQLAVLGVGTEVGAPIALPGGGFLKDDNGEIVVPALDETPLRRLVSESSGVYRRMSVDDSDLAALLAATTIPGQDDTISLDRQADRWQDMAHWFVLPLLLFALASFRRGLIYLLPLLLTTFAAPRSEAFEWQDLWLRADQQGLRALESGEPERAAELFKDPRWRGAAAYSGKDYATAADAFRGDESADGWYNRGNALAAQGELDQAIAAYERSLELKAEQPDAQKNIETLKQLQEQQQNQQQNQQGQDGSPNQDQSQDQGGNQQQNQQQQDSQQQSGNQNQQSQNGSNDQNADSQNSDQQSQDQDASADADEQGSQGDSEQSEQQGQPMALPQIDNSAMQEDLERDQAMQQWLRRVPDDPSGLLREKFRYESRQRQQQGKNRESKQIW
jgi:Ca-activated chloride channel family protein